MTSVLAELVTVDPGPPAAHGPVETFSTGALHDTVAPRDATEDIALLLLRFANGARGSVSISQVSPGARTRSSTRSMAPQAAAAWDSETPDHLWIGHRERPNQILQRGPALMNADRRRRSEPARRPRRGLRGHVPCAVPRRSTAPSRPDELPEHPTFASFADGHQEMLARRRRAAHRPRGSLGGRGARSHGPVPCHRTGGIAP